MDDGEYLDRPRFNRRRESLDEQVRRRGIKPITSVEGFGRMVHLVLTR